MNGEKSYQSLHESHKSSVRGSRSILQAYAQDQAIHTQQYDDLTQEDPLAGWTWTNASYENGTIICKVPQLDFGKIGGMEGETASLQFNVDVALNGQQFTGRPLQFRYYDIHVERIEPGIGTSGGGTVINVRL